MFEAPSRSLTLKQSLWPWTLSVFLLSPFPFLLEKSAVEIGGLLGLIVVIVSGLVYLTGLRGVGHPATLVATGSAALIAASIMSFYGVTHWYPMVLGGIVLGGFPTIMTMHHRDAWIARNELAATSPLAARLLTAIASYANEQDDPAMIFRLTAISRRILTLVSLNPSVILGEKAYFQGQLDGQHDVVKFAEEQNVRVDSSVMQTIADATFWLVKVKLDAANDAIVAVENAIKTCADCGGECGECN